MEKASFLDHLKSSPDGYVVSAEDVLEVADLVRAGEIAIEQQGDDIVARLPVAEVKD